MKKPSRQITIAGLAAATIAQRRRAPAVLLDYACGWGRDVALYAARAIKAEGYDVWPGFGRSSPPSGLFGLVALTYVVNVLDAEPARAEVVRAAARYLAPAGRLVVTARSPDEVAYAARRGAWAPHADGWWSNPARGCFQRGIPAQEIVAWGERAGLRRAPVELELAGTATVVVLERGREGT
jgi:hypothetical protein